MAMQRLRVQAIVEFSVFWSGRRESNPHEKLGKLPGYHYITPANFRLKAVFSQAYYRYRNAQRNGVSPTTVHARPRPPGRAHPPSPYCARAAMTSWRRREQCARRAERRICHPPRQAR
jgi:hypothetical protein